MKIRPVCLLFAVLALAPFDVRAQEQLEIFDAHLHYNQEPKPFYSLDQVREVFRRNGIIGIIANSRPNKGTHELSDAKWPELKVVPFIRPYRVRSDIQTWFDDPAIFDLIKDEYSRGTYRLENSISTERRRNRNGSRRSWISRWSGIFTSTRIVMKRRSSSCSATIPGPGSSGRTQDF